MTTLGAYGIYGPSPLALDSVLYKGATDCSANPNYPAANAGDLYRVSVAGKIGGASGTVVTAGDMFLCLADGTAAGTQAAVGSSWQVLQANIDLTSVDIDGGTIDGTTIGGSTPAAGNFTTLGTTGATTLGNANVYIGDTANAKSTQGLTINQGANDDEIISLKSSDVAHGFTGITEADTYGYIKKVNGDAGGLWIVGLSDTNAISGLTLSGIIGSSNPADALGATRVKSYKSDGATSVTDLAATETVFLVTNNNTDIFAITGNGNLQLGGGIVIQGSSLIGGAIWKSGTGASSSPADAAQLWVADRGGAAGEAALHVLDEGGNTAILGFSSITAGSGTGVTVAFNGNINRQTYKVTTTYAAFSDSDTTKGIVIATLPAKTKIVGFYADTTTKYTGGTVSAATLEVGVTAEGAAEILAAHDVFTAAVTKGLADADMGTSMTRAAAIQGGYLPSWTGTTAIYATIDTTDGNTNALTQGSTTFYIVTERF